MAMGGTAGGGGRWPGPRLTPGRRCHRCRWRATLRHAMMSHRWLRWIIIHGAAFLTVYRCLFDPLSNQFAYFLVVCPSIRKAGSSNPAELGRVPCGLLLFFLSTSAMETSSAHSRCFFQFVVFTNDRTHAAGVVVNTSSQ